MTVERCLVQAIHKPWGRSDLGPWYTGHADGSPIGEVWFQRTDAAAERPALLLKLLFTDAPLSIQVHPDDAYARSMGSPNGKTEAWCVLAATPDARVALGLKTECDALHLRASIEDGSIQNLVQWRTVIKGDVVLVPAGTVHAIGAGLVIAEVQQNSDTTFRLFDYGRGRPLDVERAVAVAVPGPANAQVAPIELTDARTLLVRTASFSIEHVNLPPHSTWLCSAQSEAWLLVLSGTAVFGGMDLSIGAAVFIDDDDARILVGPDGMQFLLSYVGGMPSPSLLCETHRDEESLSLDRQLEALT